MGESLFSPGERGRIVGGGAKDFRIKINGRGNGNKSRQECSIVHQKRRVANGQKRRPLEWRLGMYMNRRASGGEQGSNDPFAK